MKPKYIIVQAGGKGTRMEHLTRNKPKALVPVNNLPILFHLFKKYPESHYIVIGDYKCDVLERFLEAFAEVNYELINAGGSSGTCAGIRQALTRVPSDTPFLLIWSDLILPKEFELPNIQGNYIGVAKDFPCRWMYRDGQFSEQHTSEFGVAGMFFFQSSSVLENVREEGEFVRWLSNAGTKFDSLPLYKVKEYGLLSEYQKLEALRCRPFNQIERDGGWLIKRPLNQQGETLAVREISWYQRVSEQSPMVIPKIVSYEPLKMEFIDGKPVYEYRGLSRGEKEQILRKVVSCLKNVQSLEQVSFDKASFYEAYIGKTYRRLKKVRELVPFAKEPFIIVNGRHCQNVFACRELLETEIGKYVPDSFKLIHGDCTFSNIMLRGDGSPVLIDPRGYFGFTELCGDPAYDWAKLYYSIVGNYDQFNRKRFSLEIGQQDVRLKIESSGWEDMENTFFRLLGDEVTPRQIRLLHAIIWLSLTTYAWEDYDSVCGAFYNGLYHLEEALHE